MANALMVSACATTTTTRPDGGPRGLHANEHLDIARDHAQLADHAAQWPDERSLSAGAAGGAWVRSWDTGTEQARLAAIHRSKAAELHAAYEEACGGRGIEDAAVSPLQRYGVSGWNTSTGVILYLSPIPQGPEYLLASMKCHRAWMMLAPAGMEDCPLDLPEIELDARGDREGITVSIVTRDPALVPELQRRAAHELEAGHRAAAPQPAP